MTPARIKEQKKNKKQNIETKTKVLKVSIRMMEKDDSKRFWMQRGGWCQITHVTKLDDYQVLAEQEIHIMDEWLTNL